MLTQPGKLFPMVHFTVLRDPGTQRLHLWPKGSGGSLSWWQTVMLFASCWFCGPAEACARISKEGLGVQATCGRVRIPESRPLLPGREFVGQQNEAYAEQRPPGIQNICILMSGVGPRAKPQGF